MPPWGRGIALAAAAAGLLMACAVDRTGPRPDARVGEGPAPWGQPGWYERSLEVDGVTRWYRLYLPPDIGSPAPVVVALHGGSRSMRDMFGKRAGGPRAWLDVAREAGFLLAVPNGTDPATGDTRGDNQFWIGAGMTPDAADPAIAATDIAFIGDLLDRLERRYPVAPDRFYVAGASSGGLLTFALLIQRPERFAAGAAFIANLPDPEGGLRRPPRPTPLFLAHGTRDGVMKPEGGELMGAWFRSAEATVDWWVQANRARAGQARSRYLPDRAPQDGCRLRLTRYPAREAGAPVVHLLMEGGGHTLPSRRYRGPDNYLARQLFGNTCRDSEGAQLAWDFLRVHRAPGP